MKVKLLHFTPLQVCVKAIRTCWDSHHRSDSSDSELGEADRALIDRVGNKHKHSSTLEHLVFNFEIKGISRACLQELARHRIASYSVKSSRYTLKELACELSFDMEDGRKRASKYIVFTGNETVDNASLEALESLRCVINTGISLDFAKFALPECYKTELVWTINARSLQNFLELRSSKSAMWEIRNLAHAVFNEIPQSHKYLFKIYDKI